MKAQRICRRAVVIVLGGAIGVIPASAGPIEDQLQACHVEVATKVAALRDEKMARTAYEAKLAELLAELHEQLDQARDQLAQVVQERDRLRAAQAAKAAPALAAPSGTKTP